MAVYMEIFHTFVNQLDDEEVTMGYFQQDGATLAAMFPVFDHA